MQARLWLLLLPVALLSIGRVLGDELTSPPSGNASILLPRQAGVVSPCVAKCFTDIFPQFDCPDLTECVCHNLELRDAVGNCILASGCNIAEAFASQASQADICHYPVRDRSPTIVVVGAILLTCAIAAAILRALARGTWSGGAGYGADDYVLFLCCLPLIGVTTAVYKAVMEGLGQDIYRLTIPRIQGVLMAIFGTKASFCLLYLRIWKDGDVIFRWACWITLTILTVALIGFEFSTIFICESITQPRQAFLTVPGNPPSHIWEVLTRASTLNCINRNPQLYTVSTVNIIMDVVVLLLPVRNILQLQLNLARKLGLLATFMIGFAVTGVSITQLYFLVKNVSKIQNPSWDYFPIALWRMTEVYLSIVCCCMPMMPGLFNRLFARASESVHVPSIVNQIWSKTSGTTADTVDSDTLREWRGPHGEPLGKWRSVRRHDRAGRISGPYDSETALEMADRGVSPLDAPLQADEIALRRDGDVSE
ncbi:uncharacterized protein RCC_08864 [Ramularia collo-cygni]|uniref:Rhodopsin domain-containing protein n=1 Tax=Ramularia collo-cygni TaxID=112498 RepID=A0A2D3VL12_9PEZI|nr:uncharacterized protein RCC_08864 [Ramularia collo-cygni]CZT23154.1 uncharacterized protein RCC_08864 [Ramularia collo-cygni]